MVGGGGMLRGSSSGSVTPSLAKKGGSGSAKVVGGAGGVTVGSAGGSDPISGTAARLGGATGSGSACAIVAVGGLTGVAAGDGATGLGTVGDWVIVAVGGRT